MTDFPDDDRVLRLKRALAEFKDAMGRDGRKWRRHAQLGAVARQALLLVDMIELMRRGECPVCKGQGTGPKIGNHCLECDGTGRMTEGWVPVGMDYD